jgi:starch phosphorylase
VALGPLTPDDVTVEVVYGRPDDADEIISPAYAALAAEPPASGASGASASGASASGASASGASAAGASASGVANGLVRYSGEVPLDQPGPFGYTVRVLPNHPLLDSRAELGLVTYPQAPAGMTNGDLR